MTARYQSDILNVREEVVAPPMARSCEDHSFEFPTVIYGAMAAFFFGAMAVMAIGFAHREMVVPMAINFIFLTAFFAVPVVFVRGSPADIGPSARRWSEFMRVGVETTNGHCSGREAVVLTLILPFLILCWAVAVVAIAALV